MEDVIPIRIGGRESVGKGLGTLVHDGKGPERQGGKGRAERGKEEGCSGVVDNLRERRESEQSASFHDSSERIWEERAGVSSQSTPGLEYGEEVPIQEIRGDSSLLRGSSYEGHKGEYTGHVEHVEHIEHTEHVEHIGEREHSREHDKHTHRDRRDTGDANVSSEEEKSGWGGYREVSDVPLWASNPGTGMASSSAGGDIPNYNSMPSYPHGQAQRDTVRVVPVHREGSNISNISNTSSTGNQRENRNTNTTNSKMGYIYIYIYVCVCVYIYIEERDKVEMSSCIGPNNQQEADRGPRVSEEQSSAPSPNQEDIDVLPIPAYSAVLGADSALGASGGQELSTQGGAGGGAHRDRDRDSPHTHTHAAQLNAFPHSHPFLIPTTNTTTTNPSNTSDIVLLRELVNKSKSKLLEVENQVLTLQSELLLQSEKSVILEKENADLRFERKEEHRMFEELLDKAMDGGSEGDGNIEMFQKDNQQLNNKLKEIKMENMGLRGQIKENNIKYTQNYMEMQSMVYSYIYIYIYRSK